MEISILIAILAVTFLAFSMDWLPIDVVALTSLALLLLFDLVTAEQAISGFSNPAVITVMMMFILSQALIHTGLIRRLGQKMAQLAGASSWLAIGSLLVLSGVLSAFINNTAALALFLPVALQLARHYETSASKILLPLSYLSIVGGTCTLIGTSTNLLVSALAAEHGEEPFRVFEFLPLGAVLFVLGGAYTLLLVRFLPARAQTTDLTGKYRLSNYLTELRIPSGSRLVSQTVVDAKINERFQLNVLEVLRGDERIAFDLRARPLMADDVLLVRGAMEDILSFRDQYGLLLLTDVKLADEDLSAGNNILVEVQLSPLSRLNGRTIKDIDFRRRFGCFVLALNRTGEMIREKLTSIELRQWDTLLVFGPRTRIEALYGLDDFVPLQEVDIRISLPRRWWVAVAIIPIVVLLAAVGVMSILKASILGVVALVLSRAISVQQAYDSINWTVIFLLAAILPLGIAMENTGLATLIGESLAEAGRTLGPFAVLSLVYVATALLSEIVSNNSTAVLMVPIALTASQSLGLDGKPFLMAVAYAASASFLTPMGYQTNAMVYGPGAYRFLDYVIYGAPIKILFWLVSVLLIPVLWPLESF